MNDRIEIKGKGGERKEKGGERSVRKDAVEMGVDAMVELGVGCKT